MLSYIKWLCCLLYPILTANPYPGAALLISIVLFTAAKLSTCIGDMDGKTGALGCKLFREARLDQFTEVFRYLKM